MSLSVGIVGLPNAGKSTLFNALAGRQLAVTAARPFTTIDPHEAVVPIHDEKLHGLYDVVTLKHPEAKLIPATVTFIDIAGLIKDAHKGEGLGNQFLAKIREVDAVVHVVRAFRDVNISHVHINHPMASSYQILEDVELVNLELELGGIEKKPTVYVLNVDEEDIARSKNIKSTTSRTGITRGERGARIGGGGNTSKTSSSDGDRYDMAGTVKKIKEKFGGEAILIAAKLEEEMIALDDEERKEMFKILEWERSALERLVVVCYKLLDLNSFYTIKGGSEVTAWSIKRGIDAQNAAKEVHTEFADKFIKSEVVGIDELLKIVDIGNAGSQTDIWKLAKDKGKVRLEGRDYEVKDGDVIEFKVGS